MNESTDIRPTDLANRPIGNTPITTTTITIRKNLKGLGLDV